MDRVSGWYRRNAQKWLLGIAVVVVVVGNVDTITLAHSLARNDTLRAAVVAAAETRPSEAAGQEVAEGVEQQPPTAELGRLITELEALALPIGWVSPTDSATVAIREVRLPAASAVLAKLGGLALTALAVALGAPFWFSLLNNLVNLRASGGKPQPAASRTPRKTQGSTGEGSAK